MRNAIPTDIYLDMAPIADDAVALNIAINGRFLTQKLSGVQRYCREIVTALDRLIAADRENGGGLARHRWTLIVPPGADTSYELKAIGIAQAGSRAGHAWEQIDLARASRKARLINLGNSGPILHRDKFVVIHDAAVFRTPGNFGRTYRTVHRTLGRAMARTARLGTVSRFSRSELAAVLGVAEAGIFVAPNGSDHMVGRARDPAVLAELGLDPGRYFMVLGSGAPNKNLAMALAAFARLGRPGVKLVIAGLPNLRVFGASRADAGAGVVMAPGRTDAEIAALLASAAALVFPSRYEGFGIPPLEAMANDCAVIACDIPVVREICADGASYVPLDDVDALAAAMASHLDDPAAARARQPAASQRVHLYTWEAGARELATAVCG